LAKRKHINTCTLARASYQSLPSMMQGLHISIFASRWTFSKGGVHYGNGRPLWGCYCCSLRCSYASGHFHHVTGTGTFVTSTLQLYGDRHRAATKASEQRFCQQKYAMKRGVKCVSLSCASPHDVGFKVARYFGAQPYNKERRYCDNACMQVRPRNPRSRQIICYLHSSEKFSDRSSI
jgi:hypothetical protein